MLSQNREDIYWSQCQRVHTKVLRLHYPTAQPRPPRSLFRGTTLWKEGCKALLCGMF